MTTPSRRRLAGLALLPVAAVAAGLLVAPSATAVAPGPLSTVSLGVGLKGTAHTATLPDGTAAVFWAPDAGHAAVRVRARGQSAWGPVRSRALAPGSTAEPGDPPAIWTWSATPVGESSFLLASTEKEGSVRHLRISTIGVAPTSLPAPTTVSGTDSVGDSMVVANDAGRAVAAWTSAVDGTIRVAVRETAAGSWAAPVPVGTFGLQPSVAVASDGSITVAWLSIATRHVLARTRVGTAWKAPVDLALTVPVELGTASVAAAGNGFVLAASVIGTGQAARPGSLPVAANAVRIWSRSSSTSPWSAKAMFGVSDQYYAALRAHGLPGGGAVVEYTRMVGAIGAAPGSVRYLGVRYASSRPSATAAWSPPAVVASTSTDEASWVYSFTAGLESVAPDGTIATPGVAAFAMEGWGVVFNSGVTIRPGWSGTPSPALNLPVQTVSVDTALAPNGRLTVVGSVIFSGVVVISSALGKPFVRAVARLSTASPRRGVVVTCGSAWTDAVSVTYRWRRGGTTIAGATAATYRPRAADVGRVLSCLAVGKNATGTTVSSSTGRKVR